jgi:phosphonate transport system substrate-binding protein
MFQLSLKHRLIKRIGTAAMLSLLCTAGTLGPARAELVLTFGTYAADKPTTTVRKFKPLLNALEAALAQQLGEKVRIKTRISTTYQKGIDDLVAGKVDFARFGPASYIAAKQANADISLIAMEAVEGKKTFNGVIAVQQDSNLQSLRDLPGHSFAFGSKLSTIGRYLSQTELVNHGIFATDLKSYDYLGRHDRVGMAVAQGEYDAGALKESTYNKLRKKEVPLRAIASFPNVTKPWIARAGLSPRLLRALQTAMLGLKDKAALAAIRKSGFVEAADADYEPIRQAISQSQRFGG